MPKPITLDQLRAHAVDRTLFTPTTLRRAIEKLGFVQADPIRAPARAQDLTLRHRVKGYVAGDLERRYSRLDIEEDCFINYGFLPREHLALMHPRKARKVWGAAMKRRADELLEFVRERGIVHPRDVDAHFAHGTVENDWGGSSSATTQLLDRLHYRGHLRVAGRENGIRVYEAREHAPGPSDAEDETACLDALVDLGVRKYSPMPAASLSHLVHILRYAAPQWADQRKAAFQRAKSRLAHAPIAGQEWYWPADERLPTARALATRFERRDLVRLLAPFDPLVWDRRRFELFWGWAYRFEAYTPVPKRKLGYYALPLLWRDHVIGWANVSVRAGALHADVGYVSGSPPDDPAFRRELDLELDRMRGFLALEAGPEGAAGSQCR